MATIGNSSVFGNCASKISATLKTISFWSGLILVGLIALASTALAETALIKNYGLSALTLAIVIGMVIGNTVFPSIASGTASGVDFAKSRLLRAGIVLFGFRLTLQDIGGVGWGGLAADALMLATTFGLAILIGTRVLKLDRETSVLIGAGSAICGAAAVLATEPVIKAQAHKVSVAIATVVIFGTLSMFLYPLLFPYLGMSEHTYGVYVGSTVHEVAQVVAAGRALSESTAETAVIVKMLRVMMLAPFLILLSALYTSHAGNGCARKFQITIPWFAVFFILVSIFNSFELLPESLVQTIISVDSVLLAMAMAALGLRTHFSAFKQAGVKPILLATSLFAYLLIGGYVINLAIHNLGNW